MTYGWLLIIAAFAGIGLVAVVCGFLLGLGLVISIMRGLAAEKERDK